MPNWIDGHYQSRTFRQQWTAKNAKCPKEIGALARWQNAHNAMIKWQTGADTKDTNTRYQRWHIFHVCVTIRMVRIGGLPKIIISHFRRSNNHQKKTKTKKIMSRSFTWVDLCIPYARIIWFVVSANEWMHSANILCDPVYSHAHILNTKFTAFLFRLFM